MRRAPTLLVAACLGPVVAGCGQKRDVLTLPPVPTPVRVVLDSPADAALTPLYAALAGGDFTRGGLAVSVVTRPGAALSNLTSGVADVAVMSEPDLLLARDRGAAVVAVAALVRSPLSAVISIAPNRITKVTQLEGKSVAAPATPLATAELDTVLRTAGVAPDSVGRRRLADGADPARAVLKRTAAAVLGSWNDDAVRLVHHQPTAIKIDAAGVPTYGRYVLAVRQDEARSRGPLLRTFLQALSTGAATTVATPAAAVDQLVAANPGLRGPAELASLKATLPVIAPAAGGDPYGFADELAWRAFGKWMLSQGLLTRPDDAARALTNEFLPGQGE